MSFFLSPYIHLHKMVAVVMLFVIQTGCANYSRVVDWPEELPSMHHFVSAYENDSVNQEVQSLEEYLVWVKRFYQGWVVYSNGWLKMSQNLSEQMPIQQRPVVSQRIADIGLNIAPEWAKEKSDRYIFTNMVAVWGEALLEALERDAVFEYMDSVERDIQLLEVGQVSRQDISMQRYFPDIEEESFLF